MALPTSSLAKICNQVREQVDTLGQNPSPADWDVNVTIGAPGANLGGANLGGANNDNTLNLFFYRFEPSGFHADARPGEVQWMRVFCVITALGADEDANDDGEVEYSAGFNELRMLSQVMRLFQEQPVMLMEGDDPGEVWHVQFIHRPLADEQINQLWSTQGDTIYRPSLVYEIALAPVEPKVPGSQPARVASVGSLAHGSISSPNRPWPAGRKTRYPDVPTMVVDTANPQWAPAAAMVTGPAGKRQAALSINLEVAADFGNFPQVDIWIAGHKASDLALVGQLLQNPAADRSSGRWLDITPVTGRTADAEGLDVNRPPAPGATHFTLTQAHWSGIDSSNHSWQLQLFVERHVRFQPDSGQWVDLPHGADGGIRIRSNPLLITLTREGS